MREQQSIIEEIQSILSSDIDAEQEELEALEGRFVSAVEETNTRLRECENLLHQGLRTEALGKCEIAPNLLDIVAILDFPGREVWVDYISQFDLPAPPELQLDIAADLNEAYSEEQPLNGLMRLNRLHALARSPLKTRIGILRRLAEADQSNPIWEDDLHDFERARQNQLKDEANTAVKQLDSKQLAQLEQELLDPNWLERPPKKLISKVSATHSQLRAKEARKEMTAIEEGLTTAFSDFNLQTARSLRQRWNALVPIANLSDDDQLWELAGPALEWLDREDQQEQEERDYQTALSQLEQALDSELPKEELERHYYQAVKNDRALPDVLHRRLSERLEYQELAARRKGRLIISCVAMGVLLIGAGITYLIVRQIHNKELATSVAAATELLESARETGNFKEVSNYFDQLESENQRVAESTDIKKLKAEMKLAIEAESGRQVKFQNILDDARARGVLNASWENMPAALKCLDEAKEVAITDAEYGQILELTRKVNEKQSGMQEEVDSRFRADLDNLKSSMADADQENLTQLQNLLKQANELNDRPRVSAEYAVLVPPLINSLNSMVTTTLEKQRENRALSQITDSIGDRNRYKSALEKYSHARQTARGKALQQVLEDEFTVWVGVNAWNQFIDRSTRTDFGTLSADESKAWESEARKVQEEYKSFPAAESIQPLLDMLHSVNSRISESGEKLQNQLNNVFNNETVANLLMIRTIDGKRYYCKEPPRSSGSVLVVNYLEGFDLVKIGGVERIEKENIEYPPQSEKVNYAAPQAVFSSSAQDLMTDLDRKGWETTFIEILVLLFENTEMEPVLKLQLIESILKVASQGSLFIKQEFTSHIDLIANSNLDFTVNWIDPENIHSNLARKKAIRVLDRMEHPKTALKSLEAYKAKWKNPVLANQYEWYGWMIEDKAEDKWVCKTKTVPDESENKNLFAIYPKSETVQIVKVGEVHKGKVTLSGPSSALQEGRPVFYVKDAMKSDQKTRQLDSN
ncbi:hypothetical protein F1728_25465 [Gimesia benthica]|uniref:Uncharacterized protein n=1 Tax=Gimesia benthica TaxID=2608982 RepID=A0A6I6AKW8_9PLAN|nr:hypothetical protein [Gimesia benthica]QGQ25815.1 hypothetical protein F1728_25465 [Gimesia benthica]